MHASVLLLESPDIKKLFAPVRRRGVRRRGAIKELIFNRYPHKEKPNGDINVTDIQISSESFTAAQDLKQVLSREPARHLMSLVVFFFSELDSKVNMRCVQMTVKCASGRCCL